MPHRTLTKIFFAGTDTDVGKTYVTALVASYLRQQGLSVGVYKPVASGCEEVEGQLVAEDAVKLWEAAGKPRTLAEVCPQKFVASLAPPEAAAIEGKSVDANLLASGATRWEDFDVLLVEGAGGLFSPLADGVLNIDLAKELSAEVVVVAANRLGAIHQTLATVAAAKFQGVQPRGLILSTVSEQSDSSVEGNASQIGQYTDVPVIAKVTYDGTLDEVKEIRKLLT
ncbi:MAG: dethiobiotin synthase [Rubripirellula sp.]